MKTRHINEIVLSTAILATATARAEVAASFAGRLEIDTPVALALEAKGALAPWRMMFSGGMTEREDGTRDFSFSASGAPDIAGTFRVAEVSSRGAGAEPGAEPGGSGAHPPSVVAAEWSFTPAADVRMEMFGLMGDLRLADYGGGTIVADGETMRFPEEGHPQDIRRHGVSRLRLSDRDGGKTLSFAFLDPVDLFVQYWGGKLMSFRFILTPDDPASHLYRGGKPRTLAFTLAGAGALRKTQLRPLTVEAGPDWIPFEAAGGIVEGSALDFSALRPTGKPCGAFGRVVARGPHFEFEKRPGVPQRFYGVNLCMTANYPESLESARALARNLARVGYNAVRIHHHDGYCTDRADPAATRLDGAMMRRMDALVTACAEEGLYISTDLFVSRTNAGVPWRAVGVDRDGKMSMADFKRSVYVHEGVYSNFQAFAAAWLNHVNAHTGRRYAEEPALAWISLVNEGNIDDMSGHAFAASPGWQETWDAWLVKKKAADPATWADITSELPNGLGKNRQGRAFLVFLQDIETRFVARTRRFLADLGCRALLTDMNNCGQMTAAMEKVRAGAFDYVDTHFYVDHPAFLDKEWSRPSWCPNRNPLKGEAMGAATVSAVRILDRPFTVSEYNFCGPGRYRGVGGIATGAEAALQDWAGLWRFAWAHNIGDATAPGTQPLGYFNIANDPLLLASERASVCLFLRGDAASLDMTYAVTLPPERISSPDFMIGESARTDWVWAAWRAKIGTIRGGAPGGRALPDGGASRPGEPVGADLRAARNVGSVAAPPSFVPAGDFDTAYTKGMAEVMRELDAATSGGSETRPAVVVTNGVFLIDTPRTCGVFAEAGEHTAGVLQMALSDVPTTIWASSIDGAPLRVSRRILVTHLTDVQNTGASYADAGMTVLKDFGHLPYLMRTGKAEVELKVNGDKPSSWRVYALASDGTRTAEIPATCANGVLRFTADIARDPENATFLYELVRK